MPLENFGNIDDLDPANPLVDDPVSEGDDHLRGIKQSLQGNVQGDDTFTALLADGFIRAVVDALAFSIKGPPLLDVDNSAANALTTLRLRNLIGGLALEIDPTTGNTRLSSTDNAGAIEDLVYNYVRATGVMALHHLGVQGIRTALRAAGNSGGEVFDSGGLAHPIGFNTMPFVDFSVSRSLEIGDCGKRLRVTGSAQVVLADVFDDFACNVYCRTAGQILVTAGFVLRHYNGDSEVEFVGAASPLLPQGSAITLIQLSATTWEAWGGDIN